MPNTFAAYFSVLFSYLFLFCTRNGGCAEWNGLIFCTTPDYRSDKDATISICNEIKRLTNKNVSCVYSVDRLRCLEQILENKADFGVFKAEDLYFASILEKSSSRNLVVTNEFRQLRDQKHEFDMVVLVWDGAHINSLEDLQGKRLCHPGFEENGWKYDYSGIFSQYFEEMVVPQTCDPALNVNENKIKSSDLFFGDSCKPGFWSLDEMVDEKLKTRYNKLCAACSSASFCTQNNEYWGRQGVRACLHYCSGDVGWVRLQDMHVTLSPSSDTCDDLSFLCPDGTKRPQNSTTPCVWLSRPWPVIVSRRAVFGNVSSLMAHISNDERTWIPGTWEFYLREVISHSFEPIYEVAPRGMSPHEYLKTVPGFLDANNLHKCKETGNDKNISVCTENEAAFRKCNLMALVANVYSIEPKFRCVLTDNCLKKVAEQESDVVIISTENLAKAYEEGDLKVILYQTAYVLGELRQSSAVVSKDAKIKRLKELRGKKACFTETGGLGWNSFLMVLKENSLIDDYCDGTKEILNFFSDVCIIDIKEDDGIRWCFEDDGIIEDFGSLDLNEAQGLRCIVEGKGDVAFIDYNFIERHLNEHKRETWTSNLSKTDFRSICPYRISSQNSSNIDNCYLSIATYGQVLVHENMTLDRVEEISSAFLQLSSLLGDETFSPPLFKLFTHYKDEKNVLFESSANRLETAEHYLKRQNYNTYTKNYNFYESRLTDMIKHCQQKSKHIPNRAQSLLISNTVIIFATISLIKYFKFMLK